MGHHPHLSAKRRSAASGSLRRREANRAACEGVGLGWVLLPHFCSKLKQRHALWLALLSEVGSSSPKPRGCSSPLSPALSHRAEASCPTFSPTAVPSGRHSSLTASGALAGCWEQSTRDKDAAPISPVGISAARPRPGTNGRRQGPRSRQTHLLFKANLNLSTGECQRNKRMPLYRPIHLYGGTPLGKEKGTSHRDTQQGPLSSVWF